MRALEPKGPPWYAVLGSRFMPGADSEATISERRMS